MLTILQHARATPPSRCLLCKQQGFTLIELMIVVGIIGIIVSVTSPMYERYQRKTRQSETKIALSAIYSLEKAFYSEYSAYIMALDGIGYEPEGQRRFYWHNICAGTNPIGSVTGFSGTATRRLYAAQNSPFALTQTYSSLPGGVSWFEANGSDCAGNDRQDFQALAVGNLKTGGETDAWVINNLKVLRNVNSGL